MFTAAATLCLIGLGGVVTSKEAGLAVPDWPTSYGYNMFLFPIDQWVGNIFYEHTHRLLATFVGFLTLVLAVCLWCCEPRRWLRWLGVGALVLVVGQGVLGGLRVTELNANLGIVHATLAQLFFVVLVGIALFTSRWWQQAGQPAEPPPRAVRLKWIYIAATAWIFVQLVLGATMRHQHAGLAVPDFPLAHGQLWPARDAASVKKYNQQRQRLADSRDPAPITAAHVGLHMAHRVMALLVLAAVVTALWQSRRRLPPGHGLRRLAWGWLGLIGAQAGLGIFTVLKNKPADIATLHVVVGALALAMGAGMLMAAQRLWPEGRSAVPGLARLPVAAMNR